MNNGDSNFNNELSSGITVDNAVNSQPTDNSVTNIGDPVFNYIPTDVIDSSSVISVDDVTDNTTIDINQEVSSDPIPVADVPAEPETPVDNSIPEETSVVEQPSVEIPVSVENPVEEPTVQDSVVIPEVSETVSSEVPSFEASVESQPIEMPEISEPVATTETPMDVQIEQTPIESDMSTNVESNVNLDIPVEPIPVEAEPVVDNPVSMDVPVETVSVENPVVDNVPVVNEPVLDNFEQSYMGEVPAEFESMIAQAPIETNYIPAQESMPAPVNFVEPVANTQASGVSNSNMVSPEAVVSAENPVPVADVNSEPVVENQIYNTDIPQGMPKFDDKKKTKKRKKVVQKNGDSDAQKEKIKNTIEIFVIVIGLIVFVIIFFKDTLFPKKVEEKPEEVISTKDAFVSGMNNAFSYTRITDLRKKVFEYYKYGKGNLKLSSEAIGMKELNLDFNVSLEMEERAKLPLAYFYGNGTYDNEKLFYSDLEVYLKNDNVFFWIPKTAENDVINENKDKFFMPVYFMLDNHLEDSYAENFDHFVSLTSDYISSNLEESYFSTRDEGSSKVYELKIDGTGFRDLSYLLLPKLNLDNDYNSLMGSLFEQQIDYIDLMGDPEEYDENDENNEVYERVEELAQSITFLIDLYEENSVVNKIHVEYRDEEKTMHYIDFSFDSYNYDIEYSYKKDGSDKVVKSFHIIFKNNGDEYNVSIDYGRAFKMDLNITFSVEDKTKIPNIVAIRSYWDQDEIVRREIQYRFEKSPGISKFIKDTGINLDFIFKEPE